MKKLLFLGFLFSNFVGFAQYTLIPDVNFEKALIGLGIDSGVPDGKVITSNFDNVKHLNVSNKSITNLTGIQDFPSLKKLQCYDNQLTNLDITKNVALEELFCGKNKISSLDITKNIILHSLYCEDNQINSLNVTKNSALATLFCWNNSLTTIDVTKNTALINLNCDSNLITNLNITKNKLLMTLGCDSNLITSLDVSLNTALTSLSCGSNKLTNLDVTKNTALTNLTCNNNQINSLDLTKNTALIYLDCSFNQINSLDLTKNKSLFFLNCDHNSLTSINLKNVNNTKLSSVDFTNNPNLTCIQVDNKAYSDANWSLKKDATASYSEDCSKTAAPIAPPVITATGNQTYCPGTSQKIVETISISNDPAEPSTDAIYIQISSGYIFGQDLLKLANPASHPTIITSWDATAGKLKLYSPTGAKILYTDFVSAIKDVEFSHSSASPSGNRSFSITIGQANFLPSTGHYYQYVPNIGISWTNAKVAAEALNYYGLKGYLATILSAEEAQISGEQASGAGWIGGTDQEIEGTWKWVTGPEGLANSGTGIVFWNGLVNGSTPNYAKWNTNEPNQYLGREEDFAHITAPGVGITGSWNDLPLTGDPSGNYQPKGFIVEYGGMPGDPVLQISASTSMTMAQLTLTTPNPICASQSITLQASSTTSAINWYDAATVGNLLFTGNNFTTPLLNSTTTYYIDYGCPTRRPITVSVEPLPIPNPVTIVRQCDDNQDGIFTFNTASLETTLLNGQNNSTVTYLDAANNPLKDANGVLIVSPFPANFTTKSQTIQAVLTNNTPLKCSNKTTIDFIIDDLPEAFAVPTDLTTACDDDAIPATQDGKNPFNTSSIESTILGGQIGMKVSYYDKNGIQLASPLPNPFLTETQSITAKVENALNSNCSVVTTINFVVNPLPIVKDVEIIQCDTDLVVDGKTFFNLTVNNTEISGNAANENFTYYNSSNGAINAISADLISNELAYENTTPTMMDVWSRVSNKITGCHSVAKITLKVPATNIPPTYKIPFAPVCDDFLDTNGNNTANNDNRDGITTFDYSSTKATILALLPTGQTYTINYYKNETDALAELNAIPDISNYRNVGYPNSQDIWIRIDSDLDNACYGLGPYLTLNVEALPVANVVTIPRQCDDNNDGIVSFNTANLESDVLNGQLNKTVAYFDQANTPLKDANGVLITSPFPANFTSTSQTIKAVVTNNTTQQCFDEVLIPFIVDVTPVAFAVAPSLTTTCDDEPNPINQNGEFAFDSSTFETTILGGQTGMIVEYYDQNNILLSSPLPNPFVTNSQNITVKVVNPINPICTATTTLNFVVNPVPKIDLNLDGSSDELVCSNLSTFFVTLDAGILDGSPTTNYQYIWTKDGSIIGSNAPTLDVNEEGIYTVEVSNNLGCSRIRTITVTASNVATITSVDIVELSDINSVTVNVTGPGDYQYSLDEPSGFWQDSNFFNTVPAGIHEVYVNDKNGCGLVSQEIVIVGIPKFFTPNSDGYNDVWEIKGISKYPQAEVQLFDRYGKYLTTLNNINTNWNGTYNGAPLPADDYWYVLNLENGKPEIKGHFSLKR
jgi:gliding motility-associated-like protein